MQVERFDLDFWFSQLLAVAVSRSCVGDQRGARARRRTLKRKLRRSVAARAQLLEREENLLGLGAG